MTTAWNKKSLKQLAEMVVTKGLPLHIYYGAAVYKNIDTETAEACLIATRAQIDAKRAAESESTAQLALWLLEGAGKLTAGKAIALKGGR